MDDVSGRRCQTPPPLTPRTGRAVLQEPVKWMWPLQRTGYTGGTWAAVLCSLETLGVRLPPGRHAGSRAILRGGQPQPMTGNELIWNCPGKASRAGRIGPSVPSPLIRAESLPEISTCNFPDGSPARSLSASSLLFQAECFCPPRTRCQSVLSRSDRPHCSWMMPCCRSLQNSYCLIA